MSHRHPGLSGGRFRRIVTVRVARSFANVLPLMVMNVVNVLGRCVPPW
jgi:hypothetical protein